MLHPVNVSLKDGSMLQVEQGTTLYDLSLQVEKKYDTPIMLAKSGTILKELYQPITENMSDLEFLDLTQKDGMRVYQRSAAFLLIVAAKKLFPQTDILINHHITGGYYCEFSVEHYCNDVNIEALEEKMQELVKMALPIEKQTISLDQALDLFETHQMEDKKNLLKYRRVSSVNMYILDGIKDYFYGYMIPNVRHLTCFKLVPYEQGFILMFPDEAKPTALAKFLPQPKLSGIFRESTKWARIMEVDTVGALNDVIVSGKLETLIRISEALHEKKIAQLADHIAERTSTRLVLIAGPSSSGKTTFAKRLCIQLRVNGLKPQVISLDDYFVNREFTPLDEYGKYDFESIDALDTKLFNEHIAKLIAGEEVEIPTFNFVTGKREYKGNKMQIGEEDILVVEGIHGLNEKLSYSIPKENKFKIYISCLTQLNVDYHNRIPTTDTRLLRRMVRDNQYRGISAEQTLELWSSVRRGENKNIFPFQEEADIMFNSVLIYELCILKPKVEALLFGISRTSPYYGEAKRLLKFLEYFLSADTATIPYNSILREFIGGSCFH